MPKDEIVRQEIHFVPAVEMVQVQKIVGLCPECGMRLDIPDPQMMGQWVRGVRCKLQCPNPACKTLLFAKKKHIPSQQIQPAGAGAIPPDQLTQAILSKVGKNGAH